MPLGAGAKTGAAVVAVDAGAGDGAMRRVGEEGDADGANVGAAVGEVLPAASA